MGAFWFKEEGKKTSTLQKMKMAARQHVMRQHVNPQKDENISFSRKDGRSKNVGD